jgi:plastocyanin
MRKTSPAGALVALLLLAVGAASADTTNAGAAAPPNVKTISVYRSSFTPSMLYAASGLVVTLANQDSITHRIVLYRGTAQTSFDVTLSPGEWYTSSTPLTCSGTCSSVTYTYRDANLSNVDASGYCNSFCARLYVYNNGT